MRLLLCAIMLSALSTSSFGQQPTRLTGADLLVDLDQYVGKQVIVSDCEIFGADNSNSISGLHR